MLHIIYQRTVSNTEMMKKQKLLLVEDDQDYRQLMEKKLSSIGFDVISAGNGLEALKLMESNDIRLLITDWAMPVMSGLELIKSIRKDPSKPYVYIIVLSAYSTIKDIVKGIDVGADDYLTKPFSFVELEARIKIGERIIGLEKRLQKSIDEQAHMAQTDPLTKLFNRRYLFEIGGQLFEQGRRYNHRMSLLMVDIDRFKNVNDTYGHDIGDEALVLITKHFSEGIRNVDILGRFGGEEFIVLMPETGMDGAYKVAERLRSSISRSPLKTSGPTISLTISIGVGVQATATANIETLVKKADVALYKSKRAGRNRVSQ